MKTTYTELLAMAHRRLERHERAATRASALRQYELERKHHATLVNCERLITYIHDACF